MKYDYAVKAGGKWYPPGEEIVEETAETIEKEATENDSEASRKSKSRNTNK